MGPGFHYSGCLKQQVFLKSMIDEVKDFIDVYKWTHYVFDDVFPQNSFDTENHNHKMYGICFTPEKCETVWLCFLSNGRLSNPINLQCYGNSKNKKEQEYLYMLSVKTRYAGLRIHKLLIHLFKYLNKKYFTHFILNDDSGYWETGSEKLLENAFSKYPDSANNTPAVFIKSIPLKPGETYEAYFERVLKQPQAK